MDHVLIIEDEKDLIDTWTYYLEQAGYRTTATTDGFTGLDLAAQVQPDLILLDLHLARNEGGRRLSGLEILRTVRETSDVPIVIVTGNYTDQFDRVLGFQRGADDYLIKGNFGVQELLARVRYQISRHQRAGARNSQSDAGSAVISGDLTLDRDRRLATLAGQPLDLTPLEFKVLLYLMLNRHRSLTHQEIWDYGWREADADPVTIRNNIRMQISGLRKKLRDSQTREPRIISIRGVGYSFRG